MQYFLIAFGGALGALLRVLLSKLFPTHLLGIPIPILMINVMGCFLIGLFVGLSALYWDVTDASRYFWVSGFLGGFTTFSSFALESGLLLDKHAYIPAILYILLSVTLCILFFFIGMKIVS